MDYRLFVIPILSAFTGWLVIWMLLKLLFHPKQAWKIAGFTIQGILPGQQQKLAQTLGKLASTELASADLPQKIAGPDSFQKLAPHIEAHIDNFLRNKLTAEMPMIAVLIGDKTITQLKAVFLKELESMFPLIMENYINNLLAGQELENMVAKKLSELSTGKLEKLLKGSLAKQLLMAKMMGAFVGLSIGLAGVLILSWL